MRRPSLKWRHEHASAALFAKVVQEQKVAAVFGRYELTEDDVHFVQELIFRGQVGRTYRLAVAGAAPGKTLFV